MDKKFINALFTVSGEKIENYGEDSYLAEDKEALALIGVFDGCGGLGSQKYKELENHTGAYIASRKARDATRNWFMMQKDLKRTEAETARNSLKDCITDYLMSLKTQKSGIKGDLLKDFPTTVSVVLIKDEKKSALALYIWAGDSRGYILEKNGLIQITRDDIIGDADAYANLSEDARLSNFACANGKFYLNKRLATISSPALIISATDGCFGYFRTPMEFEYLLLDKLMDAENIEMWENGIKEAVKEISGDDFSMAMCIVGCEEFPKLKKYFSKRYEKLKKEYIKGLSGASKKECEKLWGKYKKNYYR